MIILKYNSFIMKNSILFLSLICASCSAPQDTLLEQVDRLPVAVQNDFYVSNRAPLQPQQFIKLPAGTIQPEGWLKQQLELQRNGLNGHLGEISAWLQKKDNAWLETGGQWGWEEVPYWLRGYANLAYIVQDNEMMNEARFWIENILKSQREDGNFGPVHSNDGKQDFWPNMIVLWIMQSYYEYSNDERVIDFMTKYCNYLLTVPDEDFLYSYWENSRGGDNLWSVAWLYNRTGDRNLLTLGEKIHKNTADWTKSTQLPNWHNVNVAQCFREPATYFMSPAVLPCYQPAIMYKAWCVVHSDKYRVECSGRMRMRVSAFSIPGRVRRRVVRGADGFR